MKRGLVWFREDLRIRDNPALYYASKSCPSGIAGLYIIDPDSWRQHHVAACRIEFILRGLKDLQQSLYKLGIPLLCVEVDNHKEIPTILAKTMKMIQARDCFYNIQYGLDETRQDQSSEQYLSKLGLTCHRYHDQVILPPERVKNKQDSFFKVFTFFKKRWLEVFAENIPKVLPGPLNQEPLLFETDPIPKSIENFNSNIHPELWPAGEKFAANRLKTFIQNSLFSYDKTRDFPYSDYTSHLSPYLASGMISPRQCFLKALEENQWQLTNGNSGALSWMSELIWREYYKHLLSHVPRLSMYKPYHLATDKLPWVVNDSLFSAWCQGNTGFPLVDAGMRQLKATGWMHNRLRMVTAMFLARNLFLDWRLGEKYFMQHLIDGDLAANNGGWQWCAATGADCAPYFRVFNPIRQSERFDPKGDFIRYYCPEISALNNKAIHDPWNRAPNEAIIFGYSKPMIDFNHTRGVFIEAFKELLTN